MAEQPKLVWRAAIKRATMTQKFTDKGEVRSTLQLLCEGDMLGAEGTKQLAVLQQETVVTLTIEAAQLAFSWTIPAEGGNTHAEIPNQIPGGGGGAAEESPDDLGSI